MKKLIAVITLLMSLSVYAGWPTFHVIHPEKILHELVKTAGCPVGKGRVPSDTKVLIETTGRIQHKPWFWVVNPGYKSCVTIPRHLAYIHFHQTGYYSGGRLITGYGQPGGPILFQFQFTVPDKWDCSPLNPKIKPPDVIGCAQDTSSRGL